MEKRKRVGIILMALSIFILAISWMLAGITKYIHQITGENMSFFSYIGIGVLFICGLYIFLTKE